MRFTENDKVVTEKIFEALMRKPYAELRGFLDAATIKKMFDLYAKLKRRYCRKDGDGRTTAEEAACTDDRKEPSIENKQ